MGLSVAVALDVFVTAGLSYYLRKSKTGFSRCDQIFEHLTHISDIADSMNDIIDSLVLYTVETGIITWCVHGSCAPAQRIFMSL